MMKLFVHREAGKGDQPPGEPGKGPLGNEPGAGRKVATAVALVVALALGGAVTVAVGQTAGWKIIGQNNLGMHCMDADFGVFAILPPYNTIQAQVIDSSGHLVTSSAGLTVSYEAVADPSGSINRTSAGKTNFWANVVALFKANLTVDAGLAGSNMPGSSNARQPMTFDATENWFIATGIPITPYDDSGAKNYYPLMRLSVRNSSGTVLATSDVVLPVSDEMDCATCHGSGSSPAAKPAAGWVFDSNLQRDYRLNILRLHDDRHLGSATYASALSTAGYDGRGLYTTVTVGGKAILCANCHVSEALAGSGIAGIPPLTRSIHTLHSGVQDPTNGLTLEASANRSACYRCHPGSETRCLRGAMGNAVALDGTMSIQCQNCHGTMSAVGAATRTGWFDEPGCQNCHTGTAVKNSGQIRYASVFDSSGALRAAADPTFATNPNTPVAGKSLYRFSAGHGGLQCEGCHGSTHAEYPSSHRNDNIQNTALQGHAGTLGECAACHGTTPSTTNGGPHGMHPVGQAWVSRHHDVVSSNNSAQCQACHGTDYRGTVLSRAFTDRALTSEKGNLTLWRGFQVGCYGCHNGPSNSNRNSNRPAVVTDLSASTTAGVKVPIQLLATDADGNPLTLRVVSQPANGTVGLSGTLATYFPFPGFSGTDTFTYAAWDGSVDSNLGHVSVAVAGVPCTLSCSATAPASAAQGTPVQFTGSATPSSCTGTPTYLWNFGDGSAASAFQSPVHTYASAGTFTWTLTTSLGGVTCTRTGSITINAPTTCTLSCSATVPATAAQGAAVQFTGSATPSNCTGSPSYLWNFGDGSATSTAQSPTHAYASAGTFSWTLTTSIGGVTCSRTGSITVSASSACSLTCTASVPTSGRIGRSVGFSATATQSGSGCSGSPAYRWSFGDGTTSLRATTSHTYSAAGTYTWTLRVTSGSATCTKTGTITIARRSN